MKNIIELKDINIKGCKVEYLFTVPKCCEKYFNKRYPFFVEYPEEIILETVPKSVLTVPFVAGVMFLSFVEKVSVKVDCIDKSFYESLEEISNGFKKLYPFWEIDFDVIAGEIEDCSYEPRGKYTQFFTGGVDATSALITNLDKKPTLINIWGGDILLEDTYRYKKNKRYFEDMAKAHGLEFLTIKSSLRFMYNEELLDQIVYPRVKNCWWAAVSHNVVMSALMAPYAYINKIKKHFIASSYSEHQKLRPCSNYSFINNGLRFSSCGVEQVDPFLTREGKIIKIKEFCSREQKDFCLYVCHHPVDGGNCSNCEKCFRTIMALIEKKADPNQFGFKVTKETIKNIKKYLKNHIVIPEYWVKMQDDFIADKTFWKTVPVMRWFLKFKINRKKSIIERGIRYIYYKAKGIWKGKKK